MPTSVTVIVGTRKGCFLLESDGDRRDWKRARARSATAGPSTTRSTTPDSGTIYAAAASEWHGAGVWRSADLGETWELSSEGLALRRGRRPQAVEGLGPDRRARAPARRRRGGRACSRAATAARPGRCSARSTASPAATTGTIPTNQPPGHLGLPAILPHPDEPSRFWAIVQGFGIFETTDDGASWTPRNHGLRADWPLENPEVGYCVHKLVMSPVDTRPPVPAEPRRHAPQRRRGQSWVEITEGLPTEFGFAAAAHPHDRDSFYVIPLDPGHGRCMPDGPGGRVAHAATPARRWQRLDRGLPAAATRTSACCARAWRSTRSTSPGLYFGTSTGQVFASADEGESWDEIASYLPAIASVEVAVVA